MGDVWEIGIVAPVARERTGYPTQKPEALLERLITSCTAPHDWILDPYVGSGTSMAVANRLKRRAVGIDSSPQALAVTKQRLADLQCKVQLVPVSERPVRSTRNLGIRKAS
jgi:site-specific DNA-methyltransferase (adenine-specific)